MEDLLPLYLSTLTKEKIDFESSRSADLSHSPSSLHSWKCNLTSKTLHHAVGVPPHWARVSRVPLSPHASTAPDSKPSDNLKLRIRISPENFRDSNNYIVQLARWWRSRLLSGLPRTWELFRNRRKLHAYIRDSLIARSDAYAVLGWPLFTLGGQEISFFR